MSEEIKKNCEDCQLSESNECSAEDAATQSNCDNCPQTLEESCSESSCPS